MVTRQRTLGNGERNSDSERRRWTPELSDKLKLNLTHCGVPEATTIDG